MLSKVKKVPSPYVGNLLNKWHDYIMQEKVHESIEKRTEIKQLLSQAEDNKDLVDYFILLDHRHSLCFDQEASMGDVVNMLSKGSHDLLINFYFELFAGDYEFFKKNYVKAISFYEKAEQKLSSIPNIEETKFAEFHYKIGVAYYEIDQHLVSVNKVTKARDIYKKSDMWNLEAIQCSLVVGINLYDLGRLDDADAYFRDALTEALDHGYDKPITKIYHNLGLVHWQKGSLELALHYFREAYSHEWLRDSPKGQQTVYMLSRVLYTMGQNEEAYHWYELGIEMARKFDDHEYKAKHDILYHLYEQPSIDEVKQSLAFLEERNLWPDVSKIAKGISELYEKKGDLVTSHEFLKRAFYAKEQIQRITEALG